MIKMDFHNLVKIYLMICKIKRARDARNEKNFDNKLNNFDIC